MAVDATILAEIDAAHARGVLDSSRMNDQISNLMLVNAQTNANRLAGVMEQVLFANALMDNKAGFNTPVGLAAAAAPPLPSPAATK